MKKISLLVSQYNSGEWIENRLRNITESTIYSDIEVICINANSPDPLDDETPKKFGVKYIKCPTRIGIYEAWNLAIKESTAPYIANANTDDLISPHCYEILTNILDGNINVGVVYNSWYTIGSNIKNWCDIPASFAADGAPGLYNGNFDTGQVGHFPLWRRSLHDKIGMFTDKLPSLGDADFWARVYYKTNYEFNWFRAPLGAYRWRNGQNAWSVYMTEDQWPLLNKLISEYKNENNRN